MLAKLGFHAYCIRVVVGNKAAIATNALCRDNALVDVFTGGWAGQVAVFKGAVCVGGDAGKRSSGGCGLWADKTASVGGDAKQDLFRGNAFAHEILDRLVARGLVSSNCIELGMVSTAGGPGSIKIVGGEVDKVDTGGDLGQVENLKHVDGAGEGGCQIVSVGTAKGHADDGEQFQKIGGLFRVGGIGPVDVDAVEP